jgi:hypothetical protein
MDALRCSITDDEVANEVHQAMANDSAKRVAEIRLRPRSPVFATRGRYPAPPAPARCQEQRSLTPAVPGDAFASCFAKSFETPYPEKPALRFWGSGKFAKQTPLQPRLVALRCPTPKAPVGRPSRCAVGLWGPLQGGRDRELAGGRPWHSGIRGIRRCGRKRPQFARMGGCHHPIA